MKERPWRIRGGGGVTKEKSCRRYHGGEITVDIHHARELMEERSWRRNNEGEITEDKSWKRNH